MSKTIESLVREKQLKEEGIEEFLGTIENFEYDLEEELSFRSKELISNEIDRLKDNMYRLQLGIKIIDKKIERITNDEAKKRR